MVFTFKPPSRERDKKALCENRSLLEPLDIKGIDRFDANDTTHVVSNKRNTPQTLQALVHAKYIVDDSILKELEYVTTEGNLDEPESMSRLELDFDAGWPDPLEFLPAVTREPNPKSEDYFKPDPSRNQVFTGYTFVMFDKKQYDGLQPAIVGGGGKAKLHELKLGQATVRDISKYMGEEFNAAESHAEGSGYGVLHVRLVISDPIYEEWATRIQTESVAVTGQGLVEQNEFLDAILVKDARGMVKKAPSSQDDIRLQTAISPPPPLPTLTASIQPGQDIQPDQDALRTRPDPSRDDDAPARPVSPAMERPRRLRTRAPAAASAFRGFMDDPTEPEAEPEPGPSFQEPVEVTNQADSMEIDDITAVQSPRKRPLPPDLESDEIVNAKLYPAQAAAKRRRLLEANDSAEEVIDPATNNDEPSEKKSERKTPRARGEANYEDRMRMIREKQEEVKDDELEPMHQQLEKMSFDTKQKLIKIAEFDIKARERPQTQDGRWKDAWNGRKNFKGFQKRGQPAVARNGPKIIIALEPIKVQSATEQYLAIKQTEAERKKAEREESEVSQDYADASSHLEEAPAELLDDAPRTTRTSDGGGRSCSQAPSRPRTTTTSLKRQASTTTKAAPKKRKKLNLQMGDDDDDAAAASSEEDEIPKFRFKQK